MATPSAIDWEALKLEWHERGTDKIRETLVELELVSDGSLDSLGEALADEKIWLKAFASGGAASLLAYFVFVWGMSTWELISDHSKVRKNVLAARDGYLRAHIKAKALERSPNLAEAQRLQAYLTDEHRLVHLIFNSLTIPMDSSITSSTTEPPLKVSGALLLDAMSVESAVYSGSLGATLKRADSISELCSKVLAHDLLKAADTPDGFRGLIRKVVGTHRKYYGCIALAADALQRAGKHAPEAISVLEATIKELAATEMELGEDVYASELTAYRMALASWCDRLSLHAPTVLLEAIDITYVYPFSLTGVVGEMTQDIALKCGDRAALGGLRPSKPYKLQLTDMWTWGGRRRELNSMVSLPMPTLTVELQDDDAAERNYDVEFRFNDLGNHYLRVHLALPDPTLNDINQALRRATTYCGAQDVKSRDQPWDTIADYAKQVIVDVADWIRANQYAESAPVDISADDTYEFNPDFDYHVVVSLGRAYVLGLDGSRREADKTEILEEYGSLFMQMLNRETTTLDEWICWSRPKAIPNLLGEACFPGDFAIGTESTTVLCMPSTPRWARSGYQEVAEFAATFPPLIYQTRTALDGKLGMADTFTQNDDDRDIDSQEATLDRMRSDLHQTLETIGKLRTYLVPSELLSLRAEGAFLDQLYRRSRLPELRREIDGYLERGRTVIDRMNTHEARLHDHRNRHYQDRVQLILFLVGTFSFSGVAALFLTVYYGSNIPGGDTPGMAQQNWSYEDAVLVVVLYVAVVAVGYWFMYRRPKAKALARKGRHHD
jgi:hypothetical protein